MKMMLKALAKLVTKKWI